ncbi:MAG: hypothetical protein U9N80_04725, partial [Chloroflexota bacterium]|nr:hypothetical protein [Chloroflexota bacterium]
KRNPEQIGQSPAVEVRPSWKSTDSHSEGGAGDDEMVPCSPHGGRTGVRKKLQQLSPPTSSLAL